MERYHGNATTRCIYFCATHTAVKNMNVLHVKFLIVLSDFNQIWIFSTDFNKSHQYQISVNSVIPALMYVDGWT